MSSASGARGTPEAGNELLGGFDERLLAAEVVGGRNRPLLAGGVDHDVDPLPDLLPSIHVAEAHRELRLDDLPLGEAGVGTPDLGHPHSGELAAGDELQVWLTAEGR